MEIVVVDGQGGGIGKNIVQVLKEKHPEYVIIGANIAMKESKFLPAA